MIAWVLAFIDFIIFSLLWAYFNDWTIALLISIPIGIALEYVHRTFFRKSYEEEQARPLAPVSGKRILIALAIAMLFILGLLVVALFDK